MQNCKGIGVEVMGASKYFWLRMNKDFFKRHDIRIIESMPNGKDYILFYLKLLCESVDHEGNLRFSEIIPYNEEMLSTITNTNVDIVRSAIKCFTSLNMMELLDDGTYFMTEVSKMIGSSVQDDHARESTRLRVQAYRERQKQLEQSEKRYSNVTCNGEIDIELEKDIEIEKEKEYIVDFKNEINEIITYLNQKTDSRFKASTLKTQSLIKARLKEGYTVKDFYTVIDKKCTDWKGTEYEKFLRPETLFGNKFEGYLNQKIRGNKQDVFGQVLEGSVTIHDTTGNGNDSEDAEGLLSLPF
jgi:uncharacterized phage protein (TIGR02220 family)/predicted phage replisome organizer